MHAKPYYYSLVILSACMLSAVNFLAYGCVVILFFWNIFIFRTYTSGGIKNILHTQNIVGLPALIYLLTVICFFVSDNHKSALGYLSSYFPYLFPLIISTGPVLDVKQFKNLLRAAILGITLSILACLLYAIADILITHQTQVLINDACYSKLSSYGLTRLWGSWHPTFAGTCATWALTLMVGYRVYYVKDFVFPLFIEIFLSLVLLTGIILMNSIAAITALLVSLMLILVQILIKKKVKPLPIAILILVLITFAGSIFIINPFNNSKLESLKKKEFRVTDNEAERNFLTIRMAKWISHIEIFKRTPVFGITPADIKKERKNIYIKNNFRYLSLHNFNAHNQYIETACRFGIIGFVIFITFLIYPLLSKKASPLFAPFILIAATTFLTESFLERQQGLIAFFCFYALLLKPQKAY